MSAKFKAPWGDIAEFTGVGALFSWVIAYAAAAPRLAAGPLCAAASDTLSLAGHCPACFEAAALTAAFLVSVWMARRDAPERLARAAA
ncbi:hypothetical protein [uncultured Caulobacter sp.]|uniref:hypothetical protein n=1 Tax=uncultured Caulobacter sp. TaxID=158749 RepID=UPI002622C105|nr:hypothetical protein [uncultured Caulobacter sp.]